MEREDDKTIFIEIFSKDDSDSSQSGAIGKGRKPSGVAADKLGPTKTSVRRRRLTVGPSNAASSQVPGGSFSTGIVSSDGEHERGMGGSSEGRQRGLGPGPAASSCAQDSAIMRGQCCADEDMQELSVSTENVHGIISDLGPSTRRSFTFDSATTLIHKGTDIDASATADNQRLWKELSTATPSTGQQLQPAESECDPVPSDECSFGEPLPFGPKPQVLLGLSRSHTAHSVFTRRSTDAGSTGTSPGLKSSSPWGAGGAHLKGQRSLSVGLRSEGSSSSPLRKLLGRRAGVGGGAEKGNAGGAAGPVVWVHAGEVGASKDHTGEIAVLDSAARGRPPSSPWTGGNRGQTRHGSRPPGSALATLAALNSAFEERLWSPMQSAVKGHRRAASSSSGSQLDVAHGNAGGSPGLAVFSPDQLSRGRPPTIPTPPLRYQAPSALLGPSAPAADVDPPDAFTLQPAHRHVSPYSKNGKRVAELIQRVGTPGAATVVLNGHTSEVVWASDPAYSVLGIAAQGLSKKRLLDLVLEDRLEECVVDWNMAVARLGSGQSRHERLRLLISDGCSLSSYREVWLKLYLLKANHGKIHLDSIEGSGQSGGGRGRAGEEAALELLGVVESMAQLQLGRSHGLVESSSLPVGRKVPGRKPTSRGVDPASRTSSEGRDNSPGLPAAAGRRAKTPTHSREASPHVIRRHATAPKPGAGGGGGASKDERDLSPFGLLSAASALLSAGDASAARQGRAAAPYDTQKRQQGGKKPGQRPPPILVPMLSLVRSKPTSGTPKAEGQAGPGDVEGMDEEEEQEEGVQEEGGPSPSPKPWVGAQRSKTLTADFYKRGRGADMKPEFPGKRTTPKSKTFSGSAFRDKGPATDPRVSTGSEIPRGSKYKAFGKGIFKLDVDFGGQLPSPFAGTGPRRTPKSQSRTPSILEGKQGGWGTGNLGVPSPGDSGAARNVRTPRAGALKRDELELVSPSASPRGSSERWKAVRGFLGGSLKLDREIREKVEVPRESESDEEAVGLSRHGSRNKGKLGGEGEPRADASVGPTGNPKPISLPYNIMLGMGAMSQEGGGGEQDDGVRASPNGLSESRTAPRSKTAPRISSAADSGRGGGGGHGGHGATAAVHSVSGGGGAVAEGGVHRKLEKKAEEGELAAVLDPVSVRRPARAASGPPAVLESVPTVSPRKAKRQASAAATAQSWQGLGSRYTHGKLRGSDKDFHEQESASTQRRADIPSGRGVNTGTWEGLWRQKSVPIEVQARAGDFACDEYGDSSGPVEGSGSESSGILSGIWRQVSVPRGGAGSESSGVLGGLWRQVSVPSRLKKKKKEKNKTKSAAGQAEHRRRSDESEIEPMDPPGSVVIHDEDGADFTAGIAAHSWRKARSLQARPTPRSASSRGAPRGPKLRRLSTINSHSGSVRSESTEGRGTGGAREDLPNQIPDPATLKGNRIMAGLLGLISPRQPSRGPTSSAFERQSQKPTGKPKKGRGAKGPPRPREGMREGPPHSPHMGPRSPRVTSSTDEGDTSSDSLQKLMFGGFPNRRAQPREIDRSNDRAVSDPAVIRVADVSAHDGDVRQGRSGSGAANPAATQAVAGASRGRNGGQGRGGVGASGDTAAIPSPNVSGHRGRGGRQGSKGRAMRARHQSAAEADGTHERFSLWGQLRARSVPRAVHGDGNTPT